MIHSPELVMSRTSTSLCCYYNATPQLHIVRVADDGLLLTERIVFPAERWLFAAKPEAHLYIHRQNSAGDTWVERVPCDRYQVKSRHSD